MSSLEIGVGPMSLPVIDAVIKYANTQDKPLMLIASRNQVECSELGGGYTGLNTRTFVEYVRARDLDRRVKICRDHSGPYLNDSEVGMNLDESLERTLTSLKADAKEGFDLIHVDTSRLEDPQLVAEKIFDLLKHYPKLEYEYGSETHSAKVVSPEKFESDILFVKQFVQPRFVVAQTGSYVEGTHQAGTLDVEAVAALVEIAEKHDVRLKEHNADYLEKHDVRERKRAGVGGMNIAPELGVLHTQAAVELAKRWRLEDDLHKLEAVVLAGGKWKKWMVDESSNADKFLSACHYHFTSPEYKRLADKISQKENLSKTIEKKVFKVLDRYCC